MIILKPRNGSRPSKVISVASSVCWMKTTYCIDIIKQVQAVQAALNKVNSLILDEHLDALFTTAVRGEDPVAREKVLGELSEVFYTRNPDIEREIPCQRSHTRSPIFLAVIVSIPSRMNCPTWKV